ncbi:MAG: hypothetical protein AAGB00_10625 [Planctomycetota bacterium]
MPTQPAPMPVQPAAPVDVEEAKREYRFLATLAILSLFLGCASAFTLNLVDPDLWGHVAYGQELLRDGSLPRTATHTFTAEGYRWINHENLAEIAFAVGFDALGVRGMLVGKCLLGLAVLGLMYASARAAGVRSLTCWAVLLLVATNLKAFFVMRPQLLSFACCAAMLWLLSRAFADWRAEHGDGAAACRVRWKWLVAVPPLMALWVNSHGAFVAGYCILGALLAGRIAEAILVDRRRSFGAASGLAVIGVVSLAALLANPYGAGLLEWLFESLRSPRPEITEWAAPKVTDPVFWPFVTLVVVTAAGWAFTDRRRDWTQLAILALVAWQSCLHLRHIAFFALLSGFWTTPHAASVLAKLRHRSARGLPVSRIGPVLKWSAAAVLAVAMIFQTIGISERLTKLPVLRRMYPVDTFDFMSLHGVEGRMVVSFNWAQYALAAFPESKVSFDGRFRTCYPQEVVDMNFDFLLGEHGGRRFRSPGSGPIEGERVLEYGDPEIVIVDRNYKHAVGVLERQYAKPDGEWALLYQDSVAQLWGRKRVFDDPDNPRYLPMYARVATDAARPLAVQWPAMPLQPIASPAPDAVVREVAAAAADEP